LGNLRFAAEATVCFPGKYFFVIALGRRFFYVKKNNDGQARKDLHKPPRQVNITQTIQVTKTKKGGAGMEIKCNDKGAESKAPANAVGKLTEECKNTTDNTATETALRLIDEGRSELIALIDAKMDEFKKKVTEAEVTS
jgi:hypothetical protein